MKTKPEKVTGGWTLGLIFFIVGIVAIVSYEIYWARVVVTERKGLTTAISIDADKLNSQNEGKLVHVVGMLGGSEKLADPEFNVTEDALKLRRRVWMSQWKQGDVELTTRTGTEDMKTHKVTINKTNRNYYYSQEWSEDIINSRSFHDIAYTRLNPNEKKIPNYAVTAGKITLGTFTLSSELADKIDNYQLVSLNDKNVAGVEAPLRAKAKFVNGEVYIGANPKQPKVGDLKIRIEYAPATTVSVIAVQTGNMLSADPTVKTGSVALLQLGPHTVQDMTGQFVKTNFEVRRLVWILGGLAILFGLVVMRAQRR